jgi:hypothetical protein
MVKFREICPINSWKSLYFLTLDSFSNQLQKKSFRSVVCSDFKGATINMHTFFSMQTWDFDTFAIFWLAVPNLLIDSSKWRQEKVYVKMCQWKYSLKPKYTRKPAMFKTFSVYPGILGLPRFTVPILHILRALIHTYCSKFANKGPFNPPTWP